MQSYMYMYVWAVCSFHANIAILDLSTSRFNIDLKIIELTFLTTRVNKPACTLVNVITFI